MGYIAHGGTCTRSSFRDPTPEEASYIRRRLRMRSLAQVLVSYVIIVSQFASQFASTMKFLILTLATLSTWEAASARGGFSDSYTGSWVVEVAGGREKADALARKYGFINEGQV